MSDKETLIASPTGTGTTAPNAIVELDGHLESYEHPRRSAPEIDPEMLTLVAEYCLECGFDEVSAEIEILRRQFVEDSAFVPRYTVAQLTDLVVGLAKARVNVIYEDRPEYEYRDLMDLLSAFKMLGYLIDHSDDAPLDDRIRDLEHDRYKPDRDQGDYLDPVSTLLGDQGIYMVDEHGDRIEPPEFPTS